MKQKISLILPYSPAQYFCSTVLVYVAFAISVARSVHETEDKLDFALATVMHKIFCKQVYQVLVNVPFVICKRSSNYMQEVNTAIH